MHSFAFSLLRLLYIFQMSLIFLIMYIVLRRHKKIKYHFKKLINLFQKKFLKTFNYDFNTNVVINAFGLNSEFF